MINHSIVLLPNMSGKLSYEGNPQKAIGYYQFDTNKRLNTITINTISFTGRIYIYGSLKSNPTLDSDWFIIPLTDTTDYIEFNNGNIGYSKRDNKVINIEGSYIWLKAKMDRDYLNLLSEPIIKTFIPTQHTTSATVNSDISIKPSNKPISVEKDISKYLINVGNVTSIYLTY